MKPPISFAIIVSLLVFPAFGIAQEKHALLVGVSEYKHAQMNVPKLEYPEADARSVGEALEKSDYKVVALLGRRATTLTNIPGIG